MSKCKYDMLQVAIFMCHKLWGKETISKKKHFLLFKQCCQKAYFPGSLKVGVVWKRVKG